MMEAVHIELFEHMIDTFRPGVLEPQDPRNRDIWANTSEFRQAVMRAGFDGGPTGAASSTDSRFRLFLKVPGKPGLRGVYYVSGYQDEGLVSLCWDHDQGHIVPRRREAIMATRAKG